MFVIYCMSVKTDTDGREAEGSTRIKLSGEVADELFNRKSRGESYNDVLERVLGLSNEGGER